MTLVNEEYYSKLSLPPLPPIKSTKTDKYQESKLEKDFRQLIDNQETLKETFQKVISCWQEKHDGLIRSLEDLKDTKKKLQLQLNTQSQQLDRSIKETQHYKHLYESSIFKRNNRRRSFLGYKMSSRSSSCASSMRDSVTADEIIDPILLNHNLYEEENEFDVYSTVLSEPESCTLPVSPNTTCLLSKNDSAISQNNDSQDSFSIPSEEVLTFACGDGFWNTIANGKSNKDDVDTLVSNYLRRGGNPNVAKNSDSVKSVKEGYGLIHALIAIKNTSALQKTIDAGAKMNVYPLTSKREDKITPVVLAAKMGYMNGIKLLVERGGADILEARGPYGENALHAAVQSDSDEMVGYVLRLCKNKLLEKQDNNGATPLHYACITGKTKWISLFVQDCNTKADPKDNKGETPLHYAVRNRKLNVVAKLVGELGVYPNPYIYKQVPTPLDLAKAGGLKTISEYLKNAGAKTSKELEKASRLTNDDQLCSSNSSTFSGESNHSHPTMGVKQFFHSKTSQILRGTF